MGQRVHVSNNWLGRTYMIHDGKEVCLSMGHDGEMKVGHTNFGGSLELNHVALVIEDKGHTISSDSLKMNRVALAIEEHGHPNSGGSLEMNRVALAIENQTMGMLDECHTGNENCVSATYSRQSPTTHVVHAGEANSNLIKEADNAVSKARNKLLAHVAKRRANFHGIREGLMRIANQAQWLTNSIRNQGVINGVGSVEEFELVEV
ncbi:hypothetical protein VNO78_20266 [Psophocarpus tetragonolobus]|uniref:Uncharacterized protein n=1 Tax=Psophocarpus tetragonolobus TaxID=3891 RepID=A0AAN9S901_PSOTE